MASRIALDFSEKEIDDLIDEFTKADVDHNGTLDYEEFCKFFAHHLNVQDQLTRVYKSFDTNGDGQIEIKEFLSALAASLKGTTQQKLEALFRIYDVDKNKVLTPDEIVILLNHLKQAASKVIAGVAEEDVSAQFAQNIVNKLDRDKDGCITLEEWTTVGAKTPALLNLLNVTL
eukprot:Phypoly_transcript_19331.p1 GENE.Phypoly_transcript_19331~~Phypoly_transcript_19331.p1  ORF type:complete len:174 (+),score=32.87 Phypoly_transcript_19331:77-598(+)